MVKLLMAWKVVVSYLPVCCISFSKTHQMVSTLPTMANGNDWKDFQRGWCHFSWYNLQFICTSHSFYSNLEIWVKWLAGTNQNICISDCLVWKSSRQDFCLQLFKFLLLIHASSSATLPSSITGPNLWDEFGNLCFTVIFIVCGQGGLIPVFLPCHYIISFVWGMLFHIFFLLVFLLCMHVLRGGGGFWKEILVYYLCIFVSVSCILWIIQ